VHLTLKTETRDRPDHDRNAIFDNIIFLPLTKIFANFDAICILIACLIHLLQSIVIIYIVYNIALTYIMKK